MLYHLYLVRSVKPTPQPSDQHSAKVIELRARREARRLLRQPRRPHRPDAA
jgi:hypothetical protein